MLYFTDTLVISDFEVHEILNDSFVEDVCIRCGVFTKGEESDLCCSCKELFDNEA